MATDIRTQVIPAGRGTRNTTSWAEGVRPKNPRETLNYLYPNGFPTTALLSMMKTEKPKDVEFSEYTKVMPLQAADITGVYTTSGLGTPLPNANYSAGQAIFIKCAEDFSKEVRPRHVLELRLKTDQRAAIACRVVDSFQNGSSSFIVARLIEDATNGTSRNPSLANYAMIMTSVNPEGGQRPLAVNYNSVKLWNYCQIIETPYGITGTQEEIELLYDKSTGGLKDEKREKFEIHGRMMERMFLWGRRREETVDGEVLRYSMGMIPMIHEYAPNNVFYFHLSTDAKYAGKTWLEAGMEWLDATFGEVQKYGKRERMAFCGNGARQGFTALARAYGAIQLDVQQADFGMWIERWYHNGIVIKLVTHPEFSMLAGYDNSMVIFDPANLTEMCLRNTRSMEWPRTRDGRDFSWLTETGLFFKSPPEFAFLDGIGLDNQQEAA